MSAVGVVVATYPVDIFTAHYRISGEFKPRGNPTIFLNDPDNQTLSVYDATVIPLRPGVELEPLSAPTLHISKSEIQVLVLGNMGLDVARPLPKRARLICLTDLYVLEGYFHMATDTRIEDLFTVLAGPFFFATQLQIVSLYTEATGVHAAAELAYVHKAAIHAYYTPENAPADGTI